MHGSRQFVGLVNHLSPEPQGLRCQRFSMCSRWSVAGAASKAGWLAAACRAIPPGVPCHRQPPWRRNLTVSLNCFLLRLMVSLWLCDGCAQRRQMRMLLLVSWLTRLGPQPQSERLAVTSAMPAM